MITLSYKQDGKWTDVDGFLSEGLAHEHAKEEGLASYKLSLGDRPLGVYTYTEPKAEPKPAKKKAKAEPKVEEVEEETPEETVTLEELADEWDNE